MDQKIKKMAPKETVRALCKNCLGLKQWTAEVVRNCEGDQLVCGSCPLFPYRMGERISVKVLRKFCLQCMDGDRQAVDACCTNGCQAYEYRFGINPMRQGIGASKESMKRVREPRKMIPESKNSGQGMQGMRKKERCPIFKLSPFSASLPSVY